MTLEQDLLKLEGEIYPVEIRLNAADGAVDTQNYEVYGAAESGRSRYTFSVQTTEQAGVYIVEIPALSFKKNPFWDYQICARRKSTGHEWLLVQGTIKLRYRIADVPAHKVGAPQQTFTATISADSLTVEVKEIAGVKGDRGERGFSAYEVACQNGFEGSEQEWLDSLKHDAAAEATAAATAAVAEYVKIVEQAARDAINAQILAEVAAMNALEKTSNKEN